MKTLGLKSGLFLLLWLWAACLCAADHYQQYSLDNGLEVIVKPDHRSHSAMVQLWYKVGSSYEPAGKSGLSHLLEHMMFQGTKHMNPSKFKRQIQALGGEVNAMTSYDFTMYYEKVPSRRVAKALALEAERMVNLSLNAKRFHKEKKVVQEELRLRVQDQPQALTRQRLQAASQIAHPYHHPIGGWRDDVKHLTLENLRSWYHQWYVPNNAVLVIAGDVNSSHVLKQVKHHFADIKSRDLPEYHFQKQPSPLGAQTVKVHAPAKLAWLGMAFQVPVYRTLENKAQIYALQVLQAALAEGRASRLRSHLVRQKQMAASISVHYEPWQRLNGLLRIGAVPAQGVSAHDLKQAIVKELADIQTNPPSEKELERAKRQLIAMNTFQQDTLFYQAYELGRLRAVDLPASLASHWLKGIKAVDRQTIKQVAQQYLNAQRRTTATLVPEAINDEQGAKQ